MNNEFKYNDNINNNNDNNNNNEQININEYTKRDKEGKLNIFPFLILLTILLISYLLYLFVKPSFEVKGISDIVPALREGNIGLIIDGELVNVDNPPIVDIRGEVLLSNEIITGYIDDTIFIDGQDAVIVHGDKYIRMKSDDDTYYVNYVEKKFLVPPKIINNEYYIPFSNFVNLYTYDFTYVKSTNMLILDNLNIPKTVAKVSKKTIVREKSTFRSANLGTLLVDEEIKIYDKGERWSRCLTKEGIFGYVKTKDCKDFKVQNSLKDTKDMNTYFNENTNNKKEKINLIWYQITSKNRNPKVEDMTKIESINVISPTWYRIKSIDGTVTDISDKKIVDWAHQNNLKVWALVANSFDNSDLSHRAFANIDSREKIIKTLINSAKELGLDGINVDIESLKPITGPYYVQFIKELSVFTKLNNLILSVDMYMPSDYTLFYNRGMIGRYIDYMIVMAYDEHWRTSPVEGSVASLPWVREGVKKTLDSIPSEKLILGVPSYTRKWEIKQNKIVSAAALGMNESYNDLKKNNAEIVYLNDVMQNYGEYEKNGSIYKIWLEDETSLCERLKIAKEYNLAGVATWKKGFEKDSIWKLYSEYMNE